MSNLNWVDYIILGIFFFSILAGFSRGLIKEVISLATLIAAFVIASMFANPLAAYFTSTPAVQNVVSQASNAAGLSTTQPISYLALGLSFGLLFAGTTIVGSIISYFMNVAFQTGVLGFGNRILGGLFGFVRGYIVNLVIIFIVQLTPLSAQNWWQQSQLVPSFQSSVQWLGGIVSPALAQLKDKLGNTLQNVNTQFQDLTKSYTGS